MICPSILNKRTLPIFSIITVCLNAKKDLERTGQSVLCQSFKNFEWIVIDGDSEDGTKNYLESLGEDVRYVSEADNGIYDAMNKGISLSRGEYLMFLNAADTLYDSDVLRNVSRFLGGDIVVGWLNVIKDTGNALEEVVKRVDNQDIRSKFLYHRAIPHQATFIRREMFVLYGLYDESFKICADRDFFIKIILAGARITYIKQLVATFPQNGISAVMNGTKFFRKEINLVRKKNFTLLYRIWRGIVDPVEKILRVNQL